MKLGVVLVGVFALTGVFALAATAPVAAAADSTGTQHPPWQSEETTTENNSTVSPGQQLAGALDAQSATVEGELWNRTLSDRLDDATTDEERAEVVADELDTIEAYVEALEDTRENITTAWEREEISEGEYRTSLSGFVVRAHLVERRANRTASAAEDLSPEVREEYGVDATRAELLSERAHDLYQFEDEVGQEVANETLEDGSDDAEIPIAGENAPDS
ncbi:hypothetical protein [Halorussus amylolyticus]|uniref:hypothetical protein n=1 Tax=Halorussus amylolyticus TaxID=1126242 RepID=UPI001046E79A|nr:hypothetical protein [Halorussus amylolyticus]